MASNALPAGAFLTTIQGRRCTAVPRVSAASASANRDSQAAAVTSPTQTPASPTTEAIAVVGNADANTAETGSTSTTSSSLVILTSSTPPSPAASSAQATRLQESRSVPPAPVQTPPPAALVPEAGATPQSFTAVEDVALSLETEQASVVQSSQTDGSVTVPAAEVSATSSPLPLGEGPAATPLSTTIGSPEPLPNGRVPEGEGTTSTGPAMSPLPNVNSNAVQSTVAVAGGVIGGVVAISILAFFIWWWRRRLLRRRRSTLLTPLDAVPSFDRDDKGGYVIKRGSIGPTPVSEKVKAALGQNFKRIRGHLRSKTGASAPSVNLDRGNSQFMDLPSSAQGRANPRTNGAELTTKDRFVDWWSRLAADMNFNWRLRNNAAGGDSMPAATQEKKPSLGGSQPDFLTLLNMDDRELDREALRRRASSTDNFLGGLNLNFGSGSGRDSNNNNSSSILNPFSDANAIAHTSAQPAPLAVGRQQQPLPSNPFSDANAIADPHPNNNSNSNNNKPATYVVDMRRSRGQSVGGRASRQPSSTIYNNNNNYYATATARPDSVVSTSAVSTVSALTTTTTTTTNFYNNNGNDNGRNKFRSDPFDLEAAKASITSSMAGTAGSGSSRISSSTTNDRINVLPRRPGGAHVRAESFTSKYSSGISVGVGTGMGMGMGDWSDPGPDVGPGSAGGFAAGAGAVGRGWRDRSSSEVSMRMGMGMGMGRRQSAGSEGGGVGKAM